MQSSKQDFYGKTPILTKLLGKVSHNMKEIILEFLVVKLRKKEILNSPVVRALEWENGDTSSCLYSAFLSSTSSGVSFIFPPVGVF